MNTLAEIYARHPGSDKGTTHSYIEFYERWLAPYRHTAQRVLEIGLSNGDSLRMWEEYFTHAEVWGVDRSDQPDGGRWDLRPIITEGTHHIAILDATDRAAVEARFGGMTFDIIIEDASHRIGEQLRIYANFRWFFKPGLYIIEDVQDLDRDLACLRAIDPLRRVSIGDRRAMKGRYDDVLVVIDHE